MLHAPFYGHLKNKPKLISLPPNGTKVEYISLSQSLRDLIPLHTILHKLSKIFNLSIPQSIAYSMLFEDNNVHVDLIAAPTMKPCSYITLQLSTAILDNMLIEITSINKRISTADIFTKPLVAPKFISLHLTLLVQIYLIL
jgi:hypothetical protein